MWKVTVNGIEIPFRFDVRPRIEERGTHIRIAGAEGEIWFPQNDVDELIESHTDDDMILEILDEKDLDQLMLKAQTLSESDDGEIKTVPVIVAWAIQQYKRKAKLLNDQMEEANAGQQGS